MTEPTGTGDRTTGSRRRAWLLVGIGIVVVGFIVRILFIRAGLPGLAMASPDEGTVVPKSVRLLNTDGLNPRWFLYPSGYFMTLAGLVTLMRPFMSPSRGYDFGTYLDLLAHPDPYMLAGRAISIVAGMVLLVATYLVARRVCGGRWALLATALMALSPLAVTYSHFAVTDMSMAALLTLGIWRLLVATETDRLRDIAIAAAIIGLAVGYKYNAGLILIPMFVWLLARRTPLRRRLGHAAVAGALAVGAFLVTTPYALLDWTTFSHDLEVQNDIQNNGWLGFETAPSGFIYNISPNLTTALGVVALILAAIGMVVGLRRRTTADLILWSYAIGSYLYISRWNAYADRYVLPFLPIIAVATALGARAVWRALPARHRTTAVAAVGIVAVLVQPAVGTVAQLNTFSQPEYRLRALPTIERMIPSGTRIAYEPLTPPILRSGVARRLTRIDGVERTNYWMFIVYPPQPGKPPHKLRDVCVLKRRHILWVLTSDDIERRVRAAGDRYPESVRFYDQLEQFADLELRIPPGLGPGAKVWRIRADAECPTPT